MTKSSPLLLLVATLCLVILSLAAFWIGMMPQRLFSSLTNQLKLQQGLVLDARAPRMSFDSGPVLTLQAVTVSGPKAFSLTSRDLRISFGYAALFGGKATPTSLDFGAPVINIDLSKPLMSGAGLAPEILLHDAVVKLQDSRSGSTVALSEVNGKLATASALKLDLSYIQNGDLTTLVADIEDAARLVEAGSPADVTLSSRDKILSFSGRARLKSSLQLDGQLNAEGAETQALLAWAGIPLESLKGTGEFKLDAGFSTDGLSAQLTKLTAQIGSQDITGDVTVTAGRDRAAITADVTMPMLSALSTSNMLASSWSEKALAISDLTALDAELHIKTDKLNLRQHSWGASEISLKLDSGTAKLAVKAPSASLMLTATPSTVDTEIVATSADIKAVIGGLLGFDQITGTGDMTFKASAKGNSVAALVSSLTGTATFSSAKLSIPDMDLEKPGEGWPSGTAEMNVDIEAKISDGIASLTKAELATPGRRVKLKGDIDLLRQAFDLRPTPGKVQAIKGPWSKPLFAADAGAAPPLRAVPTPAN